MQAIPKMDNLAMVFGNIDHMPKYEDVPKEFKTYGNKNPYVELVEEWFFKGMKVDRLKAKEGVDARDAMNAIHAILKSWDPKHEHKIAGAAYLLSQWFDVKPIKEEA